MAGRGGHQPPANPAPVSGPGALSQRTDRPKQPMAVPTGLPYGQAGAIRDQQHGAPMSASPGPLDEGGGTAAGVPYDGPGMMDPTGQPDVPVTAGAALGPGPGLEALPSVGDAASTQLSIRQFLGSLDQDNVAVAALMARLNRSL